VESKFSHTGERHKHSTFSLGLSNGWMEHPSIRRPAEASHSSPMASSSRHATPRKKSGAASSS
jgi:hypothetical protein